MPTDKILDRVRKLLEMSKSTNEHEAALAGARAAELMRDNAITEAMLQVTSADDVAAIVNERIVEQELPDAPERRVAWRDRIANVAALSLGCERFYWNGKITCIGHESAVATWRYLCTYLFAEIERLADEAWKENGADLAAVGVLPRGWKSAFRLGAADVVAGKMYAEAQEALKHETEQARKLAVGVVAQLSAGRESHAGDETHALTITTKTVELMQRRRVDVKAAHTERTKGFRNTRALGNTTRGRDGYSAGREAGAQIEHKLGKRAALK